MPRALSGTYSLAVGNPVVNGTTIDASWANNTLNDIANALTDSLSRSGNGGMSVPLQLVAGSAGAPSAVAPTDLTTGLYFPGTGQVALAVSGAAGLTLTTTGVGIGTTTPGARLEVNGAIRGTIGTSTLEATGAGDLTINASNASGQIVLRTAGAERMRLDAAGNLGLGVTPSASTIRSLQILRGAFSGTNDLVATSHNAYFDGAWRYIASSLQASLSDQKLGQHSWFTAPSGTAGNAITFTQAMTLTAGGELLIGATSGTGARLEVTVADAATAQRLVAATGRFRFRPYVDATNGAVFESSNSGETAYLPMTIFGSNVRLGNGNGIQAAIDSSNNVVFGTAALATTATAGFPWIPSCAGAPTGAPTAPYTNAAALIPDTTNNRLYVRMGSTWRFTPLTDAVASAIQSGTAQNTTSGTAIDFTGIPSWVRRVTVMFSNVSLSGVADPLIQLGTSGGVVTTGYAGSADNGNAPVNSTSGMVIRVANDAAALGGVIQWVNVTGNTWAGFAVIGRNDAAFVARSGATVTLGGTLDRVRITTTGSDTFDGGFINILWE